MKPCANCGNVAEAKRDLCATCWNALPEPTQRAYTNKSTTLRHVVDAVRIRRTSLKQLRGGRHTRTF